MVLKANYDAIANHWLHHRSHLPDQDQAMFEHFITQLPPNAQLLDLGCGSGEPIATMLASQGFKITGIDRSQALLAHAQQTLPSQTWLQAELEEFSTTDNYHGVIIWDSMFHLPREQHQPLLQKVYDCLLSNGVVILSSGGCHTHIPAFVDTMFEQEFFYDSYPIQELLNHCEQIGFELISKQLVNKPDGKRDKGRLGVILYKPN